MSMIQKSCLSFGVLRRFAGDDKGNIAVLFSIAVLPILSFVGAAVDYTRASNARTGMQSALDSAALMVSKDISSGTIAAADVSAKATSYFNALYTNTDANGINISATYTAKNAQGRSSIAATATGSVNTEFMKIAGFPKLDLNTASTTTWGGTRMRVAMALDVTGSMDSDGKMPAMQDAAKGLVTTLKNLSKSDDDVYISVIPFAQMVNVGTSNKNADWLKWDGLGSCSYPPNSYYNAYYSRFNTKEGCQANGGTWASSSAKGQWKGCVTDRDEPADTTKVAPTSTTTNFQAVFYLNNGVNACPAEILPMTSAYSSGNVKKINDKIEELVANGGTNQEIGMAWAWQSLQSGNPLNTPVKDPNIKYTDIIILLSDGLNTINRRYGNGSDPSSQVDARQMILCDNIKTKVNGVQETMIYTIQVNTDGDPESTVLKYCADGGNFFPTSSASGIAAAFNAIGTSLTRLRVSQ